MQVRLERLRSSQIVRESSGKNEPAVVACALALKSGENFDSDRDAKRRFGVAPSTNVRQRWLPRLMLLDAADARKAAHAGARDIGGEASNLATSSTPAAEAGDSEQLDQERWPALPSLDELRPKVAAARKCLHRPPCTSAAQHIARIQANAAAQRAREQARRQARRQAAVATQHAAAMTSDGHEQAPPLRARLAVQEQQVTSSEWTWHHTSEWPAHVAAPSRWFRAYTISSSFHVKLNLDFLSGRRYAPKHNVPLRECEVDHRPPKRKRSESEDEFAARRSAWEAALDARRQAEGQCEGTHEITSPQ